MTTQSAILYIAAMEIDSIMVTGKQVARIRDLLEIDLRTDRELTQLRNTIVITLADASAAAREDGDMQAFERLHNAMSAITAVIDETLWKRGALY